MRLAGTHIFKGDLFLTCRIDPLEISLKSDDEVNLKTRLRKQNGAQEIEESKDTDEL